MGCVGGRFAPRAPDLLTSRRKHGFCAKYGECVAGRFTAKATDLCTADESKGLRDGGACAGRFLATCAGRLLARAPDLFPANGSRALRDVVGHVSGRFIEKAANLLIADGNRGLRQGSKLLLFVSCGTADMDCRCSWC